MSDTKFRWKPFLKALAAIAIPIALQNLLTTTGSMVDTMMIAPLGETSVGAIGLCAQFSSLMFACYWGFVGGGMLFLSQFWGARDDGGINRAYGITLTCMLTVGLLFGTMGVCFPELIMRMYTDKSDIQSIGIQYLRIVGFSYPLVCYSMAMAATLRSTERVRIPLIASICSVVTNMLLNYVFIYGKLGLPVMGVRGAALATVCANLVNVAVTLLFARAKGYPYLFTVSKHFRWNREWLRLYFTRCFPIICNELAIGVANMIITIVLGRQSGSAIAALAVFRTLEGFVIAFFSGFSNAASVLVGKNVGAGEPEAAYEHAKRIIYLNAGCIFLVCLGLLSIHTPLLHAMSLSGESFTIGRSMLTIYCVIAVIRMCNWAMNDTYRSAGDATTGTVMEIVFMYAMVIPLVCLSGLKWHLPFLLVFCCCYVDEPIRFVLMQIHMYSGKWIRPVTEQGRAALPAFREKLQNRRAAKRA